jgi:hypothetical protein
MTNWYKIFYYFTIADNLKDVTLWLTLICGVVFVIMVLARVFSDSDSFFEGMNRPAKVLFFSVMFLFVLNLFAWTLLPTKKDALIIIVGGSVGNFVTRDSSIREIPADLTKYLHRYMQREINDLDLATKKELGLDTPKDRFMDKVKGMAKEDIIELLQQDTTIKVNGG